MPTVKSELSPLFGKLSPADQALMGELLAMGTNSASWIQRSDKPGRETIATLMTSARRLQIYRLSGLYDAECKQRAETTIRNLLRQILNRQPAHAEALALLADLDPDAMQEAA